MAETFGKIAKGETLGGSIETIRGSRYTSEGAGQLASMTMWVQEYNGLQEPVKLAIYDVSLNKLGETEEKVMESGIDNWVTFDFVSPPTVEAATNYYLFFWNDDRINFYYTADGTSRYKSLTYNGWPSPLTGSTTYTRDISIYATYYEAPPPPPPVIAVPGGLLSQIW